MAVAADEDHCGHRRQGQRHCGVVVVQLVHAPQLGRPTPAGQVEQAIQDDGSLRRSAVHRTRWVDFIEWYGLEDRASRDGIPKGVVGYEVRTSAARYGERALTAESLPEWGAP